MNEIIQIKCPFDGAVLSVKNQPGIENKQVTCPICKNKYPFSQYRKVVATPKPTAEEHTSYPTEYPKYDDGEDTQFTQRDPKTDLDTAKISGLGQLRVLETNRVIVLKPGTYVIGRKSANSPANIQIDTGAARSMSRQHLELIVERTPHGTYKHKVRLFKEKVNATFVNNMPLSKSDTIILADQDIIKMPDATLRFEFCDSESTII